MNDNNPPVQSGPAHISQVLARVLARIPRPIKGK